jgi:hypothetical protein
MPGKDAGQGCRARLPGKAVGQGCQARLPSKEFHDFFCAYALPQPILGMPAKI